MRPILRIALGALGFFSSLAFATAITAVQESSWGQYTAGKYDVTGDPTKGVGDRIDVTYTLPTPGSKPITVKDVGTINQSGVAVVTLAVPKGTVITFTDSTEATTAPTITALAYFTPPQDEVITPLTVVAGSMATVGGSSFALSGSFYTIGTSVDYDPNSPTYANLGGTIPASLFSIQGTSAGGNIGLSIISDTAWMINMASAWAPGTSADLVAGVVVPFSVSLSGMLTSAGGSTPFSGTATGNVTFFDNNAETINAGFNFTSALGPITGTLNASGVSSLTPEPPALVLVVGAVFGLLLMWRTYRPC